MCKHFKLAVMLPKIITRPYLWLWLLDCKP
jgi:hypothetical protein